MQTYDITAPANAPFVVHAAGKYIKYLSGNNGGGDVSLIVTPGSNPGNKVTLVPGQAYRVADDAKNPDSWTVTNATGGATILGKVVVGNGKLDDNSIAGTVQVVDGGKTRTLSGSAFMGYAAGGTPAAGNQARVSLWNPVGSGKRLVVEQIMAASGAQAIAGQLVFAQVQLTTDSGAGVSKVGGGVAAAGHLQNDITSTTSAGAAGYSVMYQLSVVANSFVTFKPTEPFIVLPGYALVLWNGAAASQMGGGFEWYEEPNI